MNPISTDTIQSLIIEIRDERVLLDSDVAHIYGVDTKRVNEAVKNNLEKFPERYLLQLTKSEWDVLKSKVSTSNRGGKVKLPFAFSERGLYMLATILKSAKATQATFAIIETFAKIRELSTTIKALPVGPESTERERRRQMLKPDCLHRDNNSVILPFGSNGTRHGGAA